MRSSFILDLISVVSTSIDKDVEELVNTINTGRVCSSISKAVDQQLKLLLSSDVALAIRLAEMTYESQISFTLDTICPWTYLAKKRLDEALRRFRETENAPKVTFTVKYFPFQLYPEASKGGEDKYEWYRKSKYGDSEEKMKMYTTLMTAHGVGADIDFKFGGIVANTLDAHRLIQHYQEERGPETADKLINSLYSQYFEHEKHPSLDETLLEAAIEAGIPQSEAKAFAEDRSEGLQDVKMLIREQAANGVDSVPYIIFEGKRRDLTLVGAKEVEKYEKALETIVKESN